VIIDYVVAPGGMRLAVATPVVPLSSNDPPKTVVGSSLSEEDLFARLAAIHIQLVENTDRWFLSGRDRLFGAFRDRCALRRERDEIEEELRRRYLGTADPGTERA
jgi:hypothetical protein